MIARGIACAALLVMMLSGGCASAPDPARATPKGTARTLIDGLAAGNASVVHSCVIKDKQQRQVADGIMALTHGMRRANSAMQMRWNESSSQMLGGPLDVSRITADAIDSATESFAGEGDKATLALNAVNLDMLKGKDGWRIDLIQSLGLDDKMIKFAVPVFSAMGNACNEVGGEIEAGKFATSSEASNALQSRAATAMADETRKLALKELRSKFWLPW